MQIELLGNLRVRPTAAVRCTESSKASELLCYLLVHRDRPRNREQLTSLLWPEGAPDRTRKYFRQALWQLRAVDDDGAEPLRLVTAEGAWVRVNPAMDLDLDLDHFEDAYARCGNPAGPELDRDSATVLGDAVRIYRGDLLEGWYQEWCVPERERLRAMYLTMLDRLMLHCMTHGDYQAGEAYGQRSLRHDHARERTHRRLMELYRSAGEHGAALRQFRLCHDVLQDELGVPPSRATVALYEQLRRESGMSSPTLPPADDGVRGGNADLKSVSDLLERLRNVRGALADIEHQVTRDIRKIEILMGHTSVARPAPPRRPEP
ncbi:BTAD domain-containing putative transcriptional regulator [Pseudonocardia tropica]|uniref:BTAD domain-containing putative transcriptional regulator n=1 Tax=Pseudonocardia tropica TaxID=681289 RepID=A0ABV1K1Z5_9PSEU